MGVEHTASTEEHCLHLSTSSAALQLCSVQHYLFRYELLTQDEQYLLVLNEWPRRLGEMESTSAPRAFQHHFHWTAQQLFPLGLALWEICV